MRREVKEETGIDDLEIVPGFRETIRYFFVAGGKRIFKIVSYYCVQTRTKEVKISDEHTGYAWLPFDEAWETLSFANAKAVLAKANRLLKSRFKVSE